MEQHISGAAGQRLYALAGWQPARGGRHGGDGGDAGLPRGGLPDACGYDLAAREEVEVGLGQGGRVLQRDVVTGRGDDDAADVPGHLLELSGDRVPEIVPGADGQDRAADRVGVMRPVLLG